MIESNGWLFLNKFPEEREKYEEYLERVTKDKIDLAKSKLDELDIKILKAIRDMKILTSIQITKLTMQKEDKSITKFASKTCNRRLKKLFELGCIDRFFPVLGDGRSMDHMHVVMGPIGAKILDIKGFRRIKFLGQNWRHTIMVNEILANLSVKYEVKDYKKEVKLEWQDGSARDYHQQPDLLINYVAQDKEKFAFIEADMGTEDMDTLVRKVKNYINYFNGEEFKLAYWQPYKQKNIAIIPEIFFIMKYEKDALTLKKKIVKMNSDILFKVTTLEQIKIPI